MSALWSSRAKVSSVLLLARRPPKDREELRRRQDAQLRLLIRHAYANVPYYRKLFDGHAVHPSMIQGTADLGLIPSSRRHALQSLPLSERLSRHSNSKRMFVRATSGSTGQPLSVYCSWFEESLLSSLRARCFRQVGVHPADRTARLGLSVAGRKGPRWIDCLQRLGLYRSFKVDSLQPPGEICRQLEEIRPHVIMGQPGVLSLVAQESGVEKRLPGLRIVLVSGETLTPLTRTHIENGFGVPVVEGYASHEFNQLAIQCRRSDYLHVNEENVLLEVLDGDRPVQEGESGEVVATALHSFSMPFIRYRIGDLATRGPSRCPCGSPCSTLSNVMGRRVDYLRLPGNRKVHAYRLILELHSDFGWIRQYQISQKVENRITLRLVPSRQPTAGELEMTDRRISAILGSGSELNIELVEELSVGPGGKTAVCQSLLETKP